MQIAKQSLSPTLIKVTVSAADSELARIRDAVLAKLGRGLKVPGFRPGKAPTHLVEKQLDQARLQNEFLEQAVNNLYGQALQQEKIRPVAAPQLTITKFVPFTLLEFTAECEVIGEVKLGDYKKLKISAEPVKISANEVSHVINNLLERSAERRKVERPAKTGDEVLIDFAGADAKTKAPITGAEGKAYPLVLGSQSFIPGFEAAVTGMKAGETKSFDLTFPADYSAAHLKGKKVSFSVTVHKVQQLEKVKPDDEWAAKVGPFQSLAELKADIKQQLQAEKDAQAQQLYDNQLLEQLVSKSQLDIPAALINQEIDRIEEEEKRNLLYRGQTWQEHLQAEGVSAEQHRENNRASAEIRIKAGVLLGEVAEKEAIAVTPKELETRLQHLKNDYAADSAMLAELDKPDNRRDLASRLLTEKTLDKLRGYARGHK